MSYTTEIQVRFRDFDQMNHVNNASYVTYLEQARANFFEEVVGVGIGEIDTALAHLEVSYERPIESAETVTVELTVGDIGESSIPMTYEIRSDGVCYATADTVLVYFDRETGESSSIPDRYRQRLA